MDEAMRIWSQSSTHAMAGSLGQLSTVSTVASAGGAELGDTQYLHLTEVHCYNTEATGEVC